MESLKKLSLQNCSITMNYLSGKRYEKLGNALCLSIIADSVLPEGIEAFYYSPLDYVHLSWWS